MPALGLRSHLAPAAAAHSSQRRLTVRVQAAAVDVPANVLEARAWIAKWKSQQPSAAAAPAHAPAPAAAAPAPAPTASKPAPTASKPGFDVKFSACRQAPDGTLVYSSASLTRVSFQEGMDAAAKKGK